MFGDCIINDCLSFVLAPVYRAFTVTPGSVLSAMHSLSLLILTKLCEVGTLPINFLHFWGHTEGMRNFLY